MQYLLSEEEYNKLVNRGKEREEELRETLQKLCTMVCDHMPVRREWEDEEEPDRPWGCTLSQEGEWYCDECPVQDECPSNRKEYSK